MGEIMLDFALTNDFELVNSFDKKQGEHLIISKSRNSKTQIGFYMIWRKEFNS